MTDLSLAARNFLAQDADLRALLGRSASWDTWIFDQSPINVRVENTSRCLIVVNEEGQWTSPNPHNTMRFPRLVVDIWADPTRNQDRTVQLFDAKSKVEDIVKIVDRKFHRVDPGTPDGRPLILGTAEQILAKTGVVVTGILRSSGPDYSPIRDCEGAFMGRLVYDVNVP